MDIGETLKDVLIILDENDSSDGLSRTEIISQWKIKDSRSFPKYIDALKKLNLVIELPKKARDRYPRTRISTIGYQVLHGEVDINKKESMKPIPRDEVRELIVLIKNIALMGGIKPEKESPVHQTSFHDVTKHLLTLLSLGIDPIGERVCLKDALDTLKVIGDWSIIGKHFRLMKLNNKMSKYIDEINHQ